MGGAGAQFLAENLERLAAQQDCQFDVVVSDQSPAGELKAVCDHFSERLDVRWVSGEGVQRSGSANVNHAIRHSEAKFVKVLFQDDLLMDPNALRDTLSALEQSGRHWALCGSCQTKDSLHFSGHRVPYLHPLIHFGRNTVSSPSVLTFERSPGLWFDETLKWLMDVDFYHRCGLTWGEPEIIPTAHVANRVHPHQVTHTISPKIVLNELRAVRQKFRGDETWAQTWEFYRQYGKNQLRALRRS